MKQYFLEKIANMSRAYFQQTDKEVPSPKILAHLQQEFSETKQKKNLLMQPIPLWKAMAAAALFLLAWGLQTWYFHPQSDKTHCANVENTVYVPVHDTVKLTEIVREIDTFFQYIEKPQPKHHPQALIAANVQPQKDSPNLAVAIPPQSRNFGLNTDVNILNVKDFEKEMQKKAGKNRQEDSLSRQFGFVSM